MAAIVSGVTLWARMGDRLGPDASDLARPWGCVEDVGVWYMRAAVGESLRCRPTTILKDPVTEGDISEELRLLSDSAWGPCANLGLGGCRSTLISPSSWEYLDWTVNRLFRESSYHALCGLDIVSDAGSSGSGRTNEEKRICNFGVPLLYRTVTRFSASFSLASTNCSMSGRPVCNTMGDDDRLRGLRARKSESEPYFWVM